MLTFLYLVSNPPQFGCVRLRCIYALVKIHYLRLHLAYSLRIIFLKQRYHICKAGNRILIALALFIERGSLLSKLICYPIGWCLWWHDFLCSFTQHDVLEKDAELAKEKAEHPAEHGKYNHDDEAHESSHLQAFFEAEAGARMARKEISQRYEDDAQAQQRSFNQTETKKGRPQGDSQKQHTHGQNADAQRQADAKAGEEPAPPSLFGIRFHKVAMPPNDPKLSHADGRLAPQTR